MKTDERLKTLWDGIKPDPKTAERLRERVKAEAEKQTGGADGRAEEDAVSPGRMLRRMRWMAAACILLAFGMSAAMLMREARAPLGYTYIADTGETLVFPPAETAAMSLHFDYPVTVRPLTAEESEGLFGRVSAVRGENPLANDDLVWRGGNTGGDLTGMPDFSGGIANDDLVWRQRVPGSETLLGDLPRESDAAYIYTGTEDGQGAGTSADKPAAGSAAGTMTPAVSVVYGTFREDSGELIRAEGRLADTKIAAAAPGIAVSDVYLGESGKVCSFDGRDVTLSSFTTPPNSRGERTAVLSASFPMTVSVETAEGEQTAEWRVTAEQAGSAEEADVTAEKLMSAVRGILAHDARIATGRE